MHTCIPKYENEISTVINNVLRAMKIALLSQVATGPRLAFTSVTVKVENLRNELRSDPVSALLATQCTRIATATV